MKPTDAVHTGPISLEEAGRACAVAITAQRELQRSAARYPGLYPKNPFDSGLYAALTLTGSFAAPWLEPEAQRPFHAINLWAFALDFAVDTEATSTEQARAVTDRCLAVVTGRPAPEDDLLLRCLADVQADLAQRPGYPALRDVWIDELRETFIGMLQECDWKAAASVDGAPLPTLDEYLANARSVMYSFCFTTFWVATSSATPERVTEVRQAVRQVQRVVRLINDLVSYDRDLTWGVGDLNALLLGLSHEEIAEHARIEIKVAEDMLAELMPLPVAVALHRHLGFMCGFWPRTDYWGSLDAPADS